MCLRAAEGRELRLTAAGSRSKRHRDKLLEKSTWFKKSRSKGEEKTTGQGADNKKGRSKEQEPREQIDYRTVLFVENTEGGELASRLRELTKRLAPILGFGVKVIERTGCIG